MMAKNTSCTSPYAYLWSTPHPATVTNEGLVVGIPDPKNVRILAGPGVGRPNANPPTPWSPEAKGKARGEAVHGRDTKVRHELSPEVQANRGRSCVCVAEALVLVFLNGSKVR